MRNSEIVSNSWVSPTYHGFYSQVLLFTYYFTYIFMFLESGLRRKVRREEAADTWFK